MFKENKISVPRAEGKENFISTYTNDKFFKGYLRSLLTGDSGDWQKIV